MTRKEAERLTRQQDTLRALGFTAKEAEQLRRISMTLRRWHERKCGDGNGCIERDEKTGRPYWYNANALYVDPHDPRARYAIPDRETDAKRRLAAILKNCNTRRTESYPEVDEVWSYSGPLAAFIQTDPRGPALYILRPGDVPAGKNASSYYSRGVCVY